MLRPSLSNPQLFNMKFVHSALACVFYRFKFCSICCNNFISLCLRVPPLSLPQHVYYDDKSREAEMDRGVCSGCVNRWKDKNPPLCLLLSFSVFHFLSLARGAKITWYSCGQVHTWHKQNPTRCDYDFLISMLSVLYKWRQMQHR